MFCRQFFSHTVSGLLQTPKSQAVGLAVCPSHLCFKRLAERVNPRNLSSRVATCASARVNAKSGSVSRIIKSTVMSRLETDSKPVSRSEIPGAKPGTKNSYSRNWACPKNKICSRSTSLRSGVRNGGPSVKNQTAESVCLKPFLWFLCTRTFL